MTHLRRLPSFLVLLLTLSTFNPGRAADVPPFQPGDRVAFLGDSIFHGGKVHANLLLFQATRHPDAPITMINAGVAGDTTSEALRRLDWDLTAHKPSVTVVMFGMNDVGRWLYGEGKDTPGNIAQRERLMANHVDGRDRVLRELASVGSRIILCTPTPFDQYAQIGTGNAVGVDDALAQVAASAREYAAAHDLPLVDFRSGMLRVLREQQAKDPAFTMMDGARVHPTPAGHLIMTYLFLKAQVVSPTVSSIALDAATGKVTREDNCSVGDVRQGEGTFSFHARSKALPYPIEEAERAVLDWVPFTDDLNREVLQVTELPPGRYELKIDGTSVGAYAAEELAAGVNLATNTATPQYRQAAEAMKLNEKRRARENATLRVFAALEHDVLRPRGIDPSDMAAVRAAMDRAIAEETEKKSWRVSYFTNLSKVYYDQKPKQAEIEKELGLMTAEVFRMCEPRAHRYELRAVN